MSLFELSFNVCITANTAFLLTTQVRMPKNAFNYMRQRLFMPKRWDLLKEFSLTKNGQLGVRYMILFVLREDSRTREFARQRRLRRVSSRS